MKLFVNTYHTIFVRVLFFFLLLFETGFSQTYPITASFQIIPPYNVYLPDYCVPGSDKIRVILLQNDLTVPTYDVRLRMTIEWNGSIIMRTSPHFNPPPITLSAGVPNLVSGDDLCIYFNTQAIDFSGYSRENYERTKVLPEGAYRISFTAYDYRRQNVQVSNAGSNIFFLQKKNPPLLNTPFCNTRIPKQDPQFITFNWSSVNTPSLPGNETEYTFSLYEIKPKNSDPNFIIRTSRPIYTTVTQHNILAYGPGEPPLLDSMEYVWIVQARSSDGRDLYFNQGKSIPCKFTYGGADPFADNQLPQPSVFAEPVHERAARVWWPLAKKKNIVESYRIEYRGSTNSQGEFPWHTEDRENDSTLTLSPLEPEREYDVRIRWKVRGVYGPYSKIVKFTTPKPKVLECGENTAVSVPANQNPLQSANVGTTVKIGSLDITLLEVSGSNGTFSGKGKIANPGFLHGLRMNFSNIFINTDLIVTRGEMHAETEGVDTFVQKELDKQHGGGNTGKPITGDVIPEIITTLSILSIDDIKVDTNKGTITIEEQQTGKEEVINYKEKNYKLPLTIEDKDGNLYQVDKNGKVTPAGKRVAPGSIPSLPALNALNLEQGKIIFGPGKNNKYAFDVWKESYTNAKELLTSRYENLNGYRVSAKAIAPGEQETITAHLEKAANSHIDPSKIKFVSGKGITYPSTSEGNDFTITITGGPADDAQEVFAIVNINGKDISIGKLLVAGYAIMEKKLVLVPIGDLRSGLQEAITQGMRKAYAPITVNYTVETDNSFANNKEWDKNKDTKLQDSKSPFLSNDFTGEEKALLKAYKRTHTIDKDAVYLFVVNEAALRNGDLLGKMPRQSQFGFLFVKDASAENIGRTAAHEIGHGAYTLSHPFSAEIGLPQGSTHTLMDYGTGYDLFKYQWDIVHQPGNVWGVFEDEGESQYETDGHYSTVYLVCLMLGMKNKQAKELAEAAEAPDTDIHSDIDFQLDQTWFYPGSQQNIHSLTGGFHGVEEMMTAFKFLYTDPNNIKKLGELLHRYGDTYAHTRLDNLSPESLRSDLLEEEKAEQYAKAWKNQSGTEIESYIPPWIKALNALIAEHGYSFLTDISLQNQVLGMSLPAYFHDIYLNQPADKFVMYGNRFYSSEHFSSDKSTPDHIYVRPNWYLTYVKNLATLLACKFQLDVSLLDINLFNRMVNFATINKCSLKGIIDYEIAKKRNKKYFYIPVFYSKPWRIIASYDAVVQSDYLQKAKDALENVKKYLKQFGLLQIKVEEIKGTYKINKNNIFDILAFKITIEQ